VVLVSLGLGSALGVLAASPAFVVIRPVLEHKGMVFAAVGMLLAMNAWMIYWWLPRRACPPGTVCVLPPMRGARVLFWVSVAIFAISLFAAYGLVPVMKMLDAVRGDT